MSERTYSAALKQQWVEPERLTSAFVALAEADPLASGARIDAWRVSQDRDGHS